MDENKKDTQDNDPANMSTDERAALGRLAMFGENDEAFPDPDEWRMIVD